ncbi:MAG TPA: DUF1214 domain-containing protein, partial [Planctomycetaceae bacterium]|nr:DUF1214 domain-containing protein [Planctomycetaceae bacterium]
GFACGLISPTALELPAVRAEDPQETLQLSRQDITEAYVYLVGRLLVLRQERLDFEEGFEWNKLVHRAPGGVGWANPNLDVVYSEAWVAVDERTPVLLEIPEIKGRYYTWQMLNGWGETVLNINERTFPARPHGKYAVCLKGSRPPIPADALRVEVPCRTSRVLVRIEIGADPQEAVQLQQQLRLSPLGQPQVEPRIEVPIFENRDLPDVDPFDYALDILDGEPDINPDMDQVRSLVRAVVELENSGPEGRRHVARVVRFKALPALVKRFLKPGPVENGWTRPYAVGNYGSDYWSRTVVNFEGIWANNTREVVYFGNVGLDGSEVYTQTFPKEALPESKAKYYWSVMAIDNDEFRVIPNPLSRYLLNKESPLHYNADGSLTLVYAARRPVGYPESNWLPTPEDADFTLTFRYYGPEADVITGKYVPPPVVRVQ